MYDDYGDGWTGYHLLLGDYRLMMSSSLYGDDWETLDAGSRGNAKRLTIELTNGDVSST